MTSLLRAELLSRFVCLGDACEDTCCQGWSMQVDAQTFARYAVQAPELLPAVEADADEGAIMRKCANGVCVKLEDGLCGIHKHYGADLLGDACYFYPRVTRRLGDAPIMTAALSCPEIARLALFADHAPLAWQEVGPGRLPQGMKDYLPDGLAAIDALAVHAAFLAAPEADGASAELAFLRIASAARSLSRIDAARWPAMAPFYLTHADSRLPGSEPNINDPFNLLHALAGLIAAAAHPPSQRLRDTVSDMAHALNVTLTLAPLGMKTGENSLAAYRQMGARWETQWAAAYEPVLKRWLAMQLSLLFFPFCAPGSPLPDRITLMGVRLATFKLALMCASAVHGGLLPQDTVLRIAQSLSRALDHVGDMSLSLNMYHETGWDREGRMRGLLEK